MDAVELEARVILERLAEGSLAQSAYLIGCAATGEALVIDPTIDTAPYIEAATAQDLRITAVAETHIHADFVSGGRALAAATGATLHVSGEGGPDWQYAFAGEPHVRVLRDGEVIRVGNIRLEAVHTPGHTPEHMIYVVTDTAASQAPAGAFTGDFLFIGDVGRPDLLETAAGQVGTMEASAARLFASLRRLSAYPDHLLIWPGHGSGSACGKSLGGVPVSSLGYERLTNWALRERDEHKFVASVLEDQPDPPLYFGEMKQVNKQGAAPWSATPALPAIPEVALAGGQKLVIDIRIDADRGTLPGAIAIPFGRNFSTWAGSVVPASIPFALVAPDQHTAAAARRALALIGRTTAEGWISPASLAGYQAKGGALESVRTTARPRAGQTLVDVRTSAEWRAGHLAGAIHVPLARLAERVASLDRSTPLLVYCQAGMRSGVAATALRRLGFADVTTLEGGLSSYRTGFGEAAEVARTG